MSMYINEICIFCGNTCLSISADMKSRQNDTLILRNREIYANNMDETIHFYYWKYSWEESLKLRIKNCVGRANNRDEWLVTGNDVDQLLVVKTGNRWLVIRNNGGQCSVIGWDGDQWLIILKNAEQWLLNGNNGGQWLAIGNNDVHWLVIEKRVISDWPLGTMVGCDWFIHVQLRKVLQTCFESNLLSQLI